MTRWFRRRWLHVRLFFNDLAIDAGIDEQLRIRALIQQSEKDRSQILLELARLD